MNSPGILKKLKDTFLFSHPSHKNVFQFLKTRNERKRNKEEEEEEKKNISFFSNTKTPTHSTKNHLNNQFIFNYNLK